MSTTDFLKYVECFKSKIQQIRILRDQSPNRYMVLLKFSGQKHADSFYKQYNGKPFNSLDPEDCKIVFVADITVSEKKKSSISSLDTDKTKVELPTCPVCLGLLYWE
jgi:BRCA1-associated protein